MKTPTCLGEASSGVRLVAGRGVERAVRCGQLARRRSTEREGPFDSFPPTPNDIRAMLDRWRRVYAPRSGNVPFLVRVGDPGDPHARGQYAFDGRAHVFSFHRAWTSDLRFPAVVAHEFGHFLNHLTNKHRTLLFLRRLRGRDSSGAFDRIDFWGLYVTGVLFLEEARADRHAMRILADDGYDPNMILDLNSEPMVSLAQDIEFPPDTLLRLARYAHARWFLAVEAIA